jgi:hypothetical protein
LLGDLPGFKTQGLAVDFDGLRNDVHFLSILQARVTRPSILPPLQQ